MIKGILVCGVLFLILVLSLAVVEGDLLGRLPR